MNRPGGDPARSAGSGPSRRDRKGPVDDPIQATFEEDAIDRTIVTAHRPDVRSAIAHLDRRQLLAGVVGVAGLAGCLSVDDDGDDGDGDGGDSDGDGGDDSDETDEPPFTIRTIDAPGSEDGELTVPESGTVTLLNFTRTACPTSAGQLETITEARASISDDRVRFVSILRAGRDPTETDEGFADWWDEHDGAWTLAVDDGAVFDYWEGNNTPTTVVLGESATPHWRSRGGSSAGDLSRGVRVALEELTGDD